MAKNFISNKDETVRMFKSDFLEAFSRVHWTVPLFLYVPVILVMLYISLIIDQLNILPLLGYFVSGVFIWTITEYLLHRFIFHFEFKGEFGKRIHFIFHGVHHDYPSDSKRLVMPPSVSVPLAALFYFIFLALLGTQNVHPFFTGFLVGYLFYDITHYAVHHFNMHSKFWLAIKNHHIKHHFQNPDKGYGVSSPFWDYIFGTTYPKKQ